MTKTEKVNFVIKTLNNLYPEIPTSIFGNKVPKGYESAFRSIEPKEIIERALKMLEDPIPHHN